MWSQLAPLLGPLPEANDVDIAECEAGSDTVNLDLVTVLVSGQNLKTHKAFVHVDVSEDGGATWIRVSNTVKLSGLRTIGARSYAIHAAGADVRSSRWAGPLGEHGWSRDMATD